MITGKLLGGKRVIGRLAGSKAGLRINMSRREEQAATEIAVIASDLAPVETGATSENIRAEPRGRAWAVVSDRGGDRPEVVVYLEFGTRYMDARPSLGPAARLYISSGRYKGSMRGIGGLL